MKAIWWVSKLDRFQERWSVQVMEDHGVGEAFGLHLVAWPGGDVVFPVPWEELFPDEAAARTAQARLAALDVLGGSSAWSTWNGAS